MTDTAAAPTADWQPTACILCSLNCGIEVRVEDRRIASIRGDKAQPALARATRARRRSASTTTRTAATG